MTPKTIDPTLVPCSACRAFADEPCRDGAGQALGQSVFHVSRIADAQREQR